jgi:hypothetical protein
LLGFFERGGKRPFKRSVSPNFHASIPIPTEKLPYYYIGRLITGPKKMATFREIQNWEYSWDEMESMHAIIDVMEDLELEGSMEAQRRAGCR